MPFKNITMVDNMEDRLRIAKTASLTLANTSSTKRNLGLEAMAQCLDVNRAKVFKANDLDVSNAERDGVPQALVKRLKVTDDKMEDMVKGIRSVIGLPEIIGCTNFCRRLDDDLDLYQICSPIGMIGVIFESRPDVIPQILSLCLKTGNGVVFKGGSEAIETNRALFNLMMQSLSEVEIETSSFVMLETREDIQMLLGMDAYVDLLIPRGSNEFVRYIQDNTRIQVLGHSSGICHIFVDSDADLTLAKKVILDSKIQYPAACNAVETVLIHREIASVAIPTIVSTCQDANVEVRLDEDAMRCFSGSAPMATEEDWDTEYNDMVLSIRTVDDIDEAISFINAHGSHHTDAIITDNMETERRFVRYVDSADVFVNASTRFADGFRFGMGAEVGISTNKIHARGPVGIEGLVTYKYVLKGNGHVVRDYVGKDARPYRHEACDKKYELGQ